MGVKRVVQEARSHAPNFKLTGIYMHTHCVINQNILGRLHFPCFIRKQPFDVNDTHSNSQLSAFSYSLL